MQLCKHLGERNIADKVDQDDICWFIQPGFNVEFPLIPRLPAFEDDANAPISVESFPPAALADFDIVPCNPTQKKRLHCLIKVFQYDSIEGNQPQTLVGCGVDGHFQGDEDRLMIRIKESRTNSPSVRIDLQGFFTRNTKIRNSDMQILKCKLEEGNLASRTRTTTLRLLQVTNTEGGF